MVEWSRERIGASELQASEREGGREEREREREREREKERER